LKARFGFRDTINYRAVDDLAAAIQAMRREGTLVQQLSVIQGIEKSAAAFLSLFDNTLERPLVKIDAA